MQVTVKAPQPNLLLESILIQNDSCVTRLWCVMMTCVQYALFRSKLVQVFSVYVHFLGYSCASAKVQARVVYVFALCTNHKWPNYHHCRHTQTCAWNVLSATRKSLSSIIIEKMGLLWGVLWPKSLVRFVVIHTGPAHLLLLLNYTTDDVTCRYCVAPSRSGTGVAASEAMTTRMTSAATSTRSSTRHCRRVRR